MAYDYNQIKKQYEGLNDQQKQQFAEMNKNDTTGNYQKFMDQYNKEKNQTPTSNESNFTNQNYTNGQNTTQNQTPTINKTENQTFGKTEFDKNEQLDESMFKEAPGKITVQEGTAKETGKPDYTLDSDARLNEMKSNLDQYFKDSPRMFNDRETFNKVFEYNNRESDAQRQLLDSYWKRKEDMDKASQYTSGESINTGMNNGEITTDQLNLLKEYSPEAYRQWQQLQEDEIKKRIVNDIVPPLLSEISENLTTMMNSLGLDPQDALDIEGIYNDTMDRTGAWKTLEDANNTVNEIKAVTDKKTEIMNRYSQSTGGTQSDALQAARMQKALAPYNEQLQGLQYQYQDYANLYNQKLATATQAANVRQMQAQENQRVWNQRYQALGFAMNALSYRTPEQQAQLRLQEQQASNEMNLLYQSKLQDLNRYNQYATTKMQNQLQAELTDLNVEDENQLRANLNNVLSDYYKNYGDIIQRSQAQTVEDIIKYAKEHGISVAQALTENFIKPLQNKAEYKQKVAKDYNMLASQSIATINGKNVILTQNPNGTISYQYIEDPESLKGEAKPYTQVDSRALNNSPMSTGYEGKTLYDFLQGKKTDETQWGGQCGKFVNDYLESIGVGRYYDNELSTKLNSVNSEVPTEGAIAVFDYNHKSSDGINHGHVGIVTKVYNDGSFDVVDSNYNTDRPEKIGTRRIYPGTNSLKGFFDPSQAPSLTNTTSTSVGGLTSSQLEDLAKQYINGDKSYSDIKATYGEDVLKAVGLKASQMGYETPTETSNIVTDNDIYDYNDATLNRKMSAEDRQKVLDARNAVYSDPNASIDDILRFSQGGKTPTDTSVQSLDKYAQALTSLGQLTDLLKDANTGPIIGALRSKNPYDKKAREINTAIAGLLPTLARGVYGEVGVLTDKDIEHYSQTVPNLRSTSEVNDAILAMSLDMLADGYKRKLQTQAALGYDVSGMKGIYDQIISKANQLKNNIGMSDSATGPDDAISEIYSSAMNTNYSSNGGNASYGGYSSDFISQMINSKL